MIDDVSVSPVCKNDVRLKRLHNRILKHLTQGKGAPLKPQKKDIKTKSNKELNIADYVTKDELVEQARREIFYEEMDWEPMKAEEIILEVLFS